MLKKSRLKNRLIAKVITRFPGLFDLDKYAGGDDAPRVESIPWAPLKKALKDSTMALVTTAGVHLPTDTPFDMEDPDGDPTYRVLPEDTRAYTITHDYYDHHDADKDINVVFPIDRLRELRDAGMIGALAQNNYGFMGHITGRHIDTLVKRTAPEVARRLESSGTDVVLLTPG